MPWTEIGDISGVVVDATVVLGAILAAVKFGLFNEAGPRLKSEFSCSHVDLTGGSTALLADYTVHNAGRRTIKLTSVNLQLVPARIENALIVPDESRVLAERTIDLTKGKDVGYARLESGERTIFTLRCVVRDLPTMVFVICSCRWRHRGQLGEYRGLYVKR